MAYINVDEFKRKLIDEKNFFPAIVARALDEMPTADVVPREEVEKIFEDLMKVANAIAEEFAKSADEATDYARIEYRGSQIGALLVLLRIAGLKKKYIGDKQRKEDGK